jgi:hypothetical protein
VRADADSSLSWSRGPYGDEGLYSAQVRNALVTGQLDLAESDAVVKTPLFAAASWLIARFVGNTMEAARTALMLLTISILAVLGSSSGSFGRAICFAIPFVFLSYYPFHYAHLALAEFLCSVIILVCVAATSARLRGGSRWFLVLAAIAAATAYATKVQFFYVAAIPPAAFFFSIMLRFLSDLPVRRKEWIDLGSAILLTVSCACAFFLVWILPNRESFVEALATSLGQQSGGGNLSVVLFNLETLISDKHTWPIFALLFIGMTTLWRQWREGANDVGARQEWIATVAPLVAWLMLEAHKLSLGYLPSRYLVSLYLAIGMLGAAGLSLMKWQITNSRKTVLAVVVAVSVVAFTANVLFFAESLRNRRYATHEAQAIFQKNGQWYGKVVIGPWAPMLFWGTGAITRPVWKGLNDHDILARQKPAAIVSEPDQLDSDGAFASDGIRLPSKADFVINIAQWRVEVFELKSNQQ